MTTEWHLILRTVITNQPFAAGRWRDECRLREAYFGGDSLHVIRVGEFIPDPHSCRVATARVRRKCGVLAQSQVRQGADTLWVNEDGYCFESIVDGRNGSEAVILTRFAWPAATGQNQPVSQPWRQAQHPFHRTSRCRASQQTRKTRDLSRSNCPQNELRLSPHEATTSPAHPPTLYQTDR